MFKRIGTAVILVATLAMAAPAPASAGFFTNVVTHVAKQVVNKVVKKAEKAVVHAVERKIRAASRD